MGLTVSDLEFLRSEQAADLLAMPLPDDPLAAQERLRQRCTPAEAAAVAMLRDLRARADETRGGKFPAELAQHLLATDVLLQQASSLRLATYMAHRLAELAARTSSPPSPPPKAPVGSPTPAANGQTPTPAPAVLDLCCGLGADALALARAGFEVSAVDIDPAAILCAEHNLAAADLAGRCGFTAADASTMALMPQDVVHVDPDRRAEGKRTVTLEDCRPDGEFLRTLPARTRAGAVKLSPMLDPRDLADWDNVALEYVSEGGVCKQLIAWWPAQVRLACEQHPPAGKQHPPAEGHRPSAEKQHPPAEPGAIAPAFGRGSGATGNNACPQREAMAFDFPPGPHPDMPQRIATVVWGPSENPEHVSLPARGAGPVIREDHGTWLIEPDPAVIAAWAVDDLAAAHDLWRIEANLVWLFGDAPADTPLARSYRILDVAAGREKNVKKALRALGAGVIEVKPRGVRLDTDKTQRRLRGDGDRAITVLWTRLGRSQRVFLAEPPT